MSKMELKRSASRPLNVTNSKRRATAAEDSPTPAEDSPLSQLFNDVGIKELVIEVKWCTDLLQMGKDFLITLRGHVNNITKESANIIYDEARRIWEFEIVILPSACTYAIDKVPSLYDKLIFYSNHDAPAERMDSMMKDPWLVYILGDRVLGLKKSDAFIRGFLSILIAYWNMRDFLDKSKLSTYGRIRTPPCSPPVNQKLEFVEYVVDHKEDFKNLREVLMSKYGSDPGLMASLFEQISNYQVNGMHLHCQMTPGKRAVIEVILHSEGSSPPCLAKTYSIGTLP